MEVLPADRDSHWPHTGALNIHVPVAARNIHMPAYLRGSAMSDAIFRSIMKTHDVRTIYTKNRDFLMFKGIKVIDPLKQRLHVWDP
jgi:hypothetical protein